MHFKHSATTCKNKIKKLKNITKCIGHIRGFHAELPVVSLLKKEFIVWLSIKKDRTLKQGIIRNK